ncbi:MAG: hypothetical protein IBX68_04440 [Dehalococcoidia bacterium]|nr:hypothetical protein [Dehalococcoidia bacterium]
MSTGTRTEADKKKVIAAIISGVSSFMQEEQVIQAELPRRQAARVTSVWSLLGREELMRMRTMWQRRLV